MAYTMVPAMNLVNSVQEACMAFARPRQPNNRGKRSVDTAATSNKTSAAAVWTAARNALSPSRTRPSSVPASNNSTLWNTTIVLRNKAFGLWSSIAAKHPALATAISNVAARVVPGATLTEILQFTGMQDLVEASSMGTSIDTANKQSTELHPMAAEGKHAALLSEFLVAADQLEISYAGLLSDLCSMAYNIGNLRGEELHEMHNLLLVPPSSACSFNSHKWVGQVEAGSSLDPTWPAASDAAHYYNTSCDSSVDASTSFSSVDWQDASHASTSSVEFVEFVEFIDAGQDDADAASASAALPVVSQGAPGLTLVASAPSLFIDSPDELPNPTLSGLQPSPAPPHPSTPSHQPPTNTPHQLPTTSIASTTNTTTDNNTVSTATTTTTNNAPTATTNTNTATAAATAPEPPAAWFAADCPVTKVRYFVIQGSSNLEHWRINVQFDPVVFEDPALGVRVHRGVYEAALRLYDDILPTVRAHLATSPFASVAFTGHSLGGSLATLVMLLLVHRGEVAPDSTSPVYAFGSPAIFCGGADHMAPEQPPHEGMTPTAAGEGGGVGVEEGGVGCGGQREAPDLLRRLGLTDDHIHNVIMHRDIVPRAFACDFTMIADLLKQWVPSLRDHTLLHGPPHAHKSLYSFLGRMSVILPDASCPFISGHKEAHHVHLPKEAGLYRLVPPTPTMRVHGLRGSFDMVDLIALNKQGRGEKDMGYRSYSHQAAAGDGRHALAAPRAPPPAAPRRRGRTGHAPHRRHGHSHGSSGSGSGGHSPRNAAHSQPQPVEPPTTLKEAIATFMNYPHPLTTLSEYSAYGPQGSISRFHNPDNYTTALLGLVGEAPYQKGVATTAQAPSTSAGKPTTKRGVQKAAETKVVAAKAAKVSDALENGSRVKHRTHPDSNSEHRSRQRGLKPHCPRPLTAAVPIPAVSMSACSTASPRGWFA